MDNQLREELKSSGTYPSGPCSAWPEERNQELMKKYRAKQVRAEEQAKKVKATAGQMAKGLVQNAGAFLRGGHVTKVIREERYDVCKACPAFIKDSKRCSECGCFMEAKTWINADPNMLCPLQKWEK